MPRRGGRIPGSAVRRPPVPEYPQAAREEVLLLLLLLLWWLLLLLPWARLQALKLEQVQRAVLRCRQVAEQAHQQGVGRRVELGLHRQADTALGFRV